MIYSRYHVFLRIVARAVALLMMFLMITQGVMAAKAKPLSFREIARGDARVLTDQGKAFLSDKIRAHAYTNKVMNISWEKDRRELEQPTIYETSYDGKRFLFVLAEYYTRIVIEVPHEKNEKRFNEIDIPGVNWVEFFHQDPRHRIDTSGFIAPRHYMLSYTANGMMFRIGLNDHLIAEDRVEDGSAQGSVPVNITLKTGPGNRLRVQSRQLSEDGELQLVLYDHNDAEREVFNLRVTGDTHEAIREFEIPADRPLPKQMSIFELEAWKTLP